LPSWAKDINRTMQNRKRRSGSQLNSKQTSDNYNAEILSGYNSRSTCSIAVDNSPACFIQVFPSATLIPACCFNILLSNSLNFNGSFLQTINKL
jgi:hypothetical protein